VISNGNEMLRSMRIRGGHLCTQKWAFEFYKVNFTLGTGHEDSEVELRYSYTLSLTSALDRVGDQRHTPAALSPGITRYPLYRRVGGPNSLSGRVWKISHLPGFVPPTLQTVASRYTD